MTNHVNPVRRYFIDAFILVLVIVGFVLLIRPDFLLNRSLLSAASFTSVLGIVACVVALMARVIVDLVRGRQSNLALKAELRKQAFKNARLRQKAKDKAQLNKPDFSKRLQDFTGEQTAGATFEQAKSKAKFWQASHLEIGPTPPRPIEFFRVLLQRISKYVGFSK